MKWVLGLDLVAKANTHPSSKNPSKKFNILAWKNRSQFQNQLQDDTSTKYKQIAYFRYLKTNEVNFNTDPRKAL